MVCKSEGRIQKSKNEQREANTLHYIAAGMYICFLKYDLCFSF